MLDHLFDDTVKINLRAQSFFSLGLRALYLFIPLVSASLWPVLRTLHRKL